MSDALPNIPLENGWYLQPKLHKPSGILQAELQHENDAKSSDHCVSEILSLETKRQFAALLKENNILVVTRNCQAHENFGEDDQQTVAGRVMVNQYNRMLAAYPVEFITLQTFKYIFAATKEALFQALTRKKPACQFAENIYDDLDDGYISYGELMNFAEEIANCTSDVRKAVHHLWQPPTAPLEVWFKLNRCIIWQDPAVVHRSGVSEPGNNFAHFWHTHNLNNQAYIQALHALKEEAGKEEGKVQVYEFNVHSAQ